MVVVIKVFTSPLHARSSTAATEAAPGDVGNDSCCVGLQARAQEPRSWSATLVPFPPSPSRTCHIDCGCSSRAWWSQLLRKLEKFLLELRNLAYQTRHPQQLRPSGSREDARYGHVYDLRLIRFPPRPLARPPCTQVCSEHCYSRRATFMATQHANECWCSRDPDLEYDRHTEIVVGEYGSCNMYCAGDHVSCCLLGCLSDG